MLRRDRLKIEGLDATFDCLTIDWLGLQNPRGRFTPRRIRLPGQEAPGLGIGERVLELLYRVVSRLDLDGLVTVAEYFHNAVLYTRELRYVDPYYQGQVLALEALLFEREQLGFAQAAWAVHWGCVRDVDDSNFEWRGEAMVRARHPDLRAWLTREAHSEHAAEVARTLGYRLSRAEFDERWAAAYESLLAPPPPSDATISGDTPRSRC
ncbi:MAG TPA: hypothetical protein ENK57_09930 [Polyangiaceae bacterium]|nr:hypothetical protein [Polyangiaceae bacterium]